MYLMCMFINVFYSGKYPKSSGCFKGKSLWYAILVQIFEGCIFHGCHKFSIFVILFLRITVFWLSIISVIINFRGVNFLGPHVIHENSKIYIP